MPHQRARNATRPQSPTAPTDTHRFAIRIAYNGALYQGFQSQTYGNTIQDQLEHRLHNLLKRRVGVVAWGRTDAGVHAKGAVVTIDLSEDERNRLSERSKDESSGCKNEAAAQILLQVLKQFACNKGVSDREGKARFGSISALKVTPVPLDFDARYSALWKRYVYYISSGASDEHLPFSLMNYAWRVKHSLDLFAMKEAGKLLNGEEHNYQWMSVIQEGELRVPRRTVQLAIEEVTLTASESELPYFLQHSYPVRIYKVTVTSDFFLYKMIRRIVGMLVSIGRGCATLDSLAECIEAHDNLQSSGNTIIEIPKELVETAPGHGLCLDHIEYNIPI